MKRFLKEPLFHFILLGMLIFTYHSWVVKDQESEESYDIVLDQSDINRITTAYQLSWSAPPDSTTLRRLLDEEIKSEIFAREAKRLGLQHDDEIIRRRLVQKYEFLIGDVTEGSQPTDEELNQYYQENIELYKSPALYSIYQFYFKEAPEDNTVQSYLLSLLDEPNPTEALERLEHSDAFHISKKVNKESLKDLELKFGLSFSEVLQDNDTIGWINKAIRSGFGYHLVFITDYQESRMLPLNEVRNKVIESWRSVQGVDFKNNLYQSLKDKYKIRVDY